MTTLGFALMRPLITIFLNAIRREISTFLKYHFKKVRSNTWPSDHFHFLASLVLFLILTSEGHPLGYKTHKSNRIIDKNYEYYTAISVIYASKNSLFTHSGIYYCIADKTTLWSVLPMSERSKEPTMLSITMVNVCGGFLGFIFIVCNLTLASYRLPTELSLEQLYKLDIKKISRPIILIHYNKATVLISQKSIYHPGVVKCPLYLKHK